MIPDCLHDVGIGALCGADHLSLGFSFLLSLMVLMVLMTLASCEGSFSLLEICNNQTHLHGTDNKDKLIMLSD